MPRVRLRERKPGPYGVVAQRSPLRTLQILTGIAAVANHYQAFVPRDMKRDLKFHFWQNLAEYAAKLRAIARSGFDYCGDDAKLVTGERLQRGAGCCRLRLRFSRRRRPRSKLCELTEDTRGYGRKQKGNQNASRHIAPGARIICFG